MIHGFTGSLFPSHPHPQPDELLGSWIARTAYANGLKTQSFVRLIAGQSSVVWNRDIDRSASTSLIEQLSMQTGATQDELRGGMLSAYEGAVFERHNPNGNTDWILPLGIYHRTRRRFGQQFCPLCLFMDRYPYYRRRWRLGFVTLCDAHGTMLHDRCPACRSPVVFIRNDLGRRSDYRIGDLTSCYHCGHDLRRAPAFSPSGPDGKTIMAMRSLVTFADMGWWFQGNAVLPYGHLYYQVLHHLVAFMLGARGRRLFDAVALKTEWHPDVPLATGRQVFEQLDVATRHRLMLAALWLLDEWPIRFVESCRWVGLTCSRVIPEGILPYWFESVVREQLTAGVGSSTAEEARQAAAFLARQGKMPSKSAVGRLLGHRDAEAAREFVQPQREAVSSQEIERIIGRLDEEIRTLEFQSPRRLILQRDKTIIQLIAVTGWPAAKVLRMTVSDGIWSGASLRQSRGVAAKVTGIVLSYLRDTRKYLAGGESGEALFIGWRRKGIGVKNWEVRWGRYRGWY